MKFSHEIFTAPEYGSWFVFPAVMVGGYWKGGKRVGIQVVFRWLKVGMMGRWEREGKKNES